MSDTGKRDNDGMALTAAEYALGVLNAAQRRAAERRIGRDPAFAREVAFWEERLGGLASAIPEVAPPHGLWSRIEAGLGRAAGAHGERVGLWRSLNFWRGLALGASALAAGRNRPVVDDSGAAVGIERTGETVGLETGLVLTSVGYRGVAVPGLPFDDAAGIIPHLDGRVLDGTEPVPGMYVTGWIKRGPSGFIGTNKTDSAQTVASLLDDLESNATEASAPRRRRLLGRRLGVASSVAGLD